MIPLRDQELIRQKFAEELKGPVKIDLFTIRPSPVFIPGRQECHYCPEAEQLLSEIDHLSPRIELRVHELGSDRKLEQRYGIERVPAAVVRGAVHRPLVYYGLPAAELFPVLLESIVDVSGEPPSPTPLIRRRLKRLKRLVRVEVLTLPSAPHCAEMARVAQLLALASQYIRAEVVEAAEFPALVERYGVRAVPTTVIDEKVVLPGIVPPEELADQIVRAAEQRTVVARSPIITGRAAETSTPLPAPPQPPERGQTRPSGLIIPGR